MCLLWASAVIIPMQGQGRILKSCIPPILAFTVSYMCWPNMDVDIKVKVKDYPQCQDNQKSPYTIAMIPWE